MAAPAEDWRSPNKRKLVIQKLEESFKGLSNPPTNLQNPVEVEKALFEKSKNLEEYRNNFHNVILMLTRQKHAHQAQPNPMMAAQRPMMPGQQQMMNQPYQQSYNQYGGGMGGGPNQVPHNPAYQPGMGTPQPRPQQPPQYHPGMYPSGGNPNAGMQHMQQQQQHQYQSTMGMVPGYPQQGRPMPGSNFAAPHNMMGGGNAAGFNNGGMPGAPYNQQMMSGGMPHGGMIRQPVMRPGPMVQGQRPGIQGQPPFIMDNVGVQPVTVPSSPASSAAYPGASTGQLPIPSPVPPTPPATSGIGSPATQPAMTPEENEAYLRKLGELQKYIPLMSKWISRLSKDDRKDDRKSDQFLKLKSLHNLLQDNNKRVPLQTLMQCENALEKMLETPDPASSTAAEREEMLKKYNCAMKEGNIPMQSTNSVVLGVAGSGKTHSLAMALEEAIPEERHSTPLLNAPVRSVAEIKIGVKDRKLIRMKGKKYFDLLMKTVKRIAQSTPGHLPMAPSSLELEDNKHNRPKYIQELKDEMIRHVVHETQYEDQLHDLAKLKDLWLPDLLWNKLTDCGGQPQFLEILPIFMHNISLGIITIKLNERLDHFPMIEYYKDGKPVGQPYRSCYSHEQILRYCMRSLISQGRRTKTKFLFVGTHRDLKEDSIGESIADKNVKLLKIVRSFKMEENVFYCNQKFDLIYAINAKSPKAEDWEVMRLVREVMVDSSDVPCINIPIKWFAMELALLRFVEDKKQAVLLESTCFELVEEFHFDQTSFKAALQYLHQIKLIFYSEVTHLIVVKIQVFLDILSELVRFNIELHTNPKHLSALEFKWKKFRQYGILHISCLQKFPEHYTEGVFSPNKLLQMFTDLCIVSKLGSDEYLMPCTLLSANENSCCCADPKTYPVPAIAVEFSDGGPMLGTFCGLVCYLITTSEWVLLKDGNGDPFCLTRNSIHFKAPMGFPGKVIINDPLSTFFLVTYDGPLEVASCVCPLIHQTIVLGVEHVSKSLNYFPLDENLSSCPQKLRVTFLCPCMKTPLHAATISNDGKFLTCPEDFPGFEAVEDKHKTWFGETSFASNTSFGSYSSECRFTSSEGFPLSVKTLTILKWKDENGCVQRFRFANEVKGKWREFGRVLGFSSELDSWDTQYRGDALECVTKVLKHWLEGRSTEKDYPPTWKGLYAVLEDIQCSQIALDFKNALVCTPF